MATKHRCRNIWLRLRAMASAETWHEDAVDGYYRRYYATQKAINTNGLLTLLLAATAITLYALMAFIVMFDTIIASARTVTRDTRRDAATVRRYEERLAITLAALLSSGDGCHCRH